ncbi:copper homeostasis membrane protein CopD [Rhizobium grahamii]|uniref:Copper-binding protein n=1 Tax=Rhizobium grahamii TaxID=1120045 RepID=A0A370KJX4_9HYPH|nr:copper homeostasis membrane protein CopD [Rhizobium grahamii]RDJ06914.1 copper-binding protein [Rhizobium grahamii]
MTPGAALILCRFSLYGSAMFLWGASAYLGWFVPSGLAAQVGQQLRTWYRLALFLVVITTALTLPLQAATIGEGWTDAFQPKMLKSILGETNVGQAWIGQACATVFLLLSFVVPFVGRRATAVGAAPLLISATMTGHAAMNSGWLRPLHRINDGLHLLSGGAWIGALPAIVVILPKLREPMWQQDARLALTRFSTAGHVAVGLVITTGIANTILVVKAPPIDWQIDYQRLLGIKILIVCLLVGIAINNRYILVPRLGRSATLRWLKWATIAEMAFGFLVLGLVAVFGTLQPT